MLHSVVKPVTEGTDGSVIAASQVFAGVAKTGGAGKTTALMVFSGQGLNVFASIGPQSADNL